MSAWIRLAHCPLCHKRWCTVTDTGTIRCMRVPSDHECPGGGWLHPYPGTVPQPAIQLARRQARRHRATDIQSIYDSLPLADPLEARRLGLPEWTLDALGAKWCARARAVAFPMYDHLHRVVGLRYRQPNGRKFSERGGKEGVFWPIVDCADTIYLPEGPTDTAALLACDLPTIGRPSCLGAQDMIAFLRYGLPSIVLADNDQPGLDGAYRLSRKLGNAPVIRPPDGLKDWRDTYLARGKEFLKKSLSIAEGPP